MAILQEAVLDVIIEVVNVDVNGVNKLMETGLLGLPSSLDYFRAYNALHKHLFTLSLLITSYLSILITS